MTVKLNKDSEVIIDDNYAWLDNWKWSLHKNGYAYRQEWIGKKHTNIYMHIIINNTPKGFKTDHINQDRLDNRKRNLRTVDTVTNASNSHSRGYEFNRNSYCARLMHGGVRYYLGTFRTKEQALEARSIKRKELGLLYGS